MKRITSGAAMVILLSMPMSADAQTREQREKMEDKLNEFFAKYEPQDQEMLTAPKMLSWNIDNGKKTVTISADDVFAAQEFTYKSVSKIYKKIRKALVKPYNKYKVTVLAGGMIIDELIPDRPSMDGDKSKLWGNIDYKGNPWVFNASTPYKITHGLQNRHVSLWASHGRYFDSKNSQTWKWQRPKLFCTTEDLYTQTIVVPYLIPMLENAGAVVFTPRERDWQKNEVIVDNDMANLGTQYIEVNSKEDWEDAPSKGFAWHNGDYSDGENPFEAGTARQCKATKSKKRYSMVSYQPRIPEEGRYAVYVSYQTVDKSVDDAEYTVWHKGEKTTFHVNQQMGGGTWVYLGTFDFDMGSSEYNRVVVTNLSGSRGVVTTDAVRFGGGMGNISRGGSTSGMPRCLEGARYYAQWAGMPYSIYSTRGGTDDYADDINVRSLMTNYLGGGSCYIPTKEGRNVPIELSLAVHSDAGYVKNDSDLIGSLAICTTNFNDGRLNAGVSRLASRDLAESLVNNLALDLKYKYGTWHKRGIYDRNYSETRLPEVPSAIIETLSHQNFNDMLRGQNPNFRFTLARSVYKTILRYICDQHDRPYIVTPLTPENFNIKFTGEGEVTLSWTPQNDPQESTSRPMGYVVYMSTGTAGFDNGTYIRSANSMKIKLEPGVMYSFRVAAVNKGGCSFPSEVLCAVYNPRATRTVMIVNGFHRLSSPAIINDVNEQGFDMDIDPGVTYGPTAGFVGRQQEFSRSLTGIEGPEGLGWSGDELAGEFVAGNDMNYVMTHTKAIMAAGDYNIVSCSSEAINNGRAVLTDCDLADIILGLECDDEASLGEYKTFTRAMRDEIEAFVEHGGSLLVSGSYVASDMQSYEEKKFLAETLKCSLNGFYKEKSDTIIGMGTDMMFYHDINSEHYAAMLPDVLTPTGNAFPALKYGNGSIACVAYNGNDYKALTMGFPFECIRTDKKRANIMKGLLKFLMK